MKEVDHLMRSGELKISAIGGVEVPSEERHIRV